MSAGKQPAERHVEAEERTLHVPRRAGERLLGREGPGGRRSGGHAWALDAEIVTGRHVAGEKKAGPAPAFSVPESEDESD